METFIAFVGVLTKADPTVLVAIVCIVALLVVAECVRQLCKTLGKKGGE